jgi:hypothetical protein
MTSCLVWIIKIFIWECECGDSKWMKLVQDRVKLQVLLLGAAVLNHQFLLLKCRWLVIRAFAVHVFLYPRFYSTLWGASTSYPRSHFKSYFTCVEPSPGLSKNAMHVISVMEFWRQFNIKTAILIRLHFTRFPYTLRIPGTQLQLITTATCINFLYNHKTSGLLVYSLEDTLLVSPVHCDRNNAGLWLYLGGVCLGLMELYNGQPSQGIMMKNVDTVGWM